MIKTTGEYAQDPSVIGLTGAAKKAAIKALYDADKAATPATPRAKLPTTKQLGKLVREYDAAFHKIKVTQETEKAVAVNVLVDFCDRETAANLLAWLPKSQLVNGQAPGWLLSNKLIEIEKAARLQNSGSVIANFA